MTQDEIYDEYLELIAEENNRKKEEIRNIFECLNKEVEPKKKNLGKVLNILKYNFSDLADIDTKRIMAAWFTFYRYE